VSSRVARLDREGRVRVGRRRDRHRLHIRECERVGERGTRVGDIEALGAPRGPGGVTSDQRAHVEARGPQRRHVDTSAEAGPDHDGAERHLTTGPSLVALVGIDELAQRLSASEPAEIVDEDLERGAL